MNTLKRLELFSKNLKRVMEEDNISQKELADEIGVSQQMISKYISGENIPSVPILLEISDYLCCTLDELFEEE